MKNIFISLFILTSLGCFAQKTQYIGTKNNTVEVRNNLRIKALKNNATMDSVLITTADGDVVQIDNRFYLLNPLQSFDSLGLTWIRCIGCGGGAVTFEGSILNGNTLSENREINTMGNMLSITGNNNGLPVMRSVNTGTAGAAIVGEGTGGNKMGIYGVNFWEREPPLSENIGNSATSGIFAQSISAPAIKGYSSKGIGMMGTGGTYSFYGIQNRELDTLDIPAIITKTFRASMPDNYSQSWAMMLGESPVLGPLFNSFRIRVSVDNITSKKTTFTLNASNGSGETSIISGSGATGSVRFHNYGIGIHDGTPSYDIKTDASGNIIEKVSEIFADADMRTTSEFFVMAPGIYNLIPENSTIFNLYDPAGAVKKFVVINSTNFSQDCTSFFTAAGVEKNVIEAHYVYTFYSDGSHWIGVKNN